MSIDQRPPVAVGHVRLPATDIATAESWLQSVGLRPIFADDDLAVLELRGGTHIVVRKTEQTPMAGSAAPFDLMVDDIEAARRDYAAKGLGPSEISRGRIHEFLPPQGTGRLRLHGHLVTCRGEGGVGADRLRSCFTPAA